MARSLRKELDSLMKAQLEQSEAFNEAMTRPDDLIPYEQMVKLLVDWNGILRQAVLLLAEEIDRLDGVEI
jgi:hypothetical protein